MGREGFDLERALGEEGALEADIGNERPALCLCHSGGYKTA